MTGQSPTFVWDNDYHNTEQVRPYLDDFLVVHAELEADGRYPYNDSFRGRIPGIAGPDEDTAIYLLQTLKRLDELHNKVEAFLADGGERVDSLDQTRRGTVVHYGFYMGGTGWNEWHQARLLPRDGKPFAVLPKGRRTNGHYVAGGHVLIRED